jgi:hypothetical protein
VPILVHHIIRSIYSIHASLIVGAQVSHCHLTDTSSRHSPGLDAFLNFFVGYVLRRWTESLLAVTPDPGALLEALLALLCVYSFKELVAACQNC